MQDIDLKVTGATVTIDFGRAAINVETLEERTHEVLSLLSNLLLADSVWQNLTDSEREGRLNAWAAMGMMVQSDLQTANKRAKLLVAIADGSESISNHGFPEFQDGQLLDV